MGVQLMAVVVDEPAKNMAVSKRLELDFPVLSDPDTEAIRAFGLLHEKGFQGADISRPAIYLIENGAVRWRDLTDNWRVRVRADELLALARENLSWFRPTTRRRRRRRTRAGRLRTSRRTDRGSACE